jgi:hypothetical protein
MYPKLVSLLYSSLSQQQSTHQCCIRAVRHITESVRGDCRCKARPREISPASLIAATIVAAIKTAGARLALDREAVGHP